MVGEMLQRPMSPDEIVEVELSVRVIPFAVGRDGLEVALCREADSPSDAQLPSGRLRRGELLTDCAERVARETLSIPPDSPPKTMAVAARPNPRAVIVSPRSSDS